MKTTLSLFLLFTICCTFSFGRGPAEFPSEALSRDSVPAYKVNAANDVFNKLKQSIGLIQSDAPGFKLDVVLPDNYSGASINYTEQMIYLEEAAYDICTNVAGADSMDALAVYLGHELAHFHENHEVKNHYAWEFKQDLKNIIFNKIKGDIPEPVKNNVVNELRHSLSTVAEREADMDGGFMAYLAGYKTVGIGEPLLDKTYIVFNIKDTINYPTLKERKDIVKETEIKLNDLIDYFETGNLLVALGQYEDALLYYKEVLKDFQSREIYNNIGVLYIHSFLKKADFEKIKYHFPVELDIKSRLSSKDPTKEENLKKLLISAIEHFDAAIAKDGDYPIAQLNRGCAHTLMAMYTEEQLIQDEQFAIARAAALRALVLARNDTRRWQKTKGDTYILMGIIEAVNGDSLQALTYFNKAMEMLTDATLVEINKKILVEGKYKSPSIDRKVVPDLRKSRIDGQIFGRIGVALKKQMQKNETHVMTLYDARFPASKVLYHLVQTPGDKEMRSAIFQLVNQDAPSSLEATTKGIKRGDSRKKITDLFEKEPDTEIELGQGKWLLYRDYGIIFQLDHTDKLSRWCLFEQTIKK